MSGVKIDNFSTTDIKLTAIMDTLQALRLGHFKLSLTEMDSTSEPEIAAGSIVEVDGSLIYFDADTEITDPDIVSDGTIYVKMYYDSGSIIVKYTETAPTFSSAKNGWYGTGASAGHRYISKMILSSGSYTGKSYLDYVYMPYIYETQSETLTGYWTDTSTHDLVFTFTQMDTVEAVISYCDHNYIAADIGTITGFLISGNTVTVTYKQLGSTGTGYISGMMTVAGY